MIKIVIARDRRIILLFLTRPKTKNVTFLYISIFEVDLKVIEVFFFENILTTPVASVTFSPPLVTIALFSLIRLAKFNPMLTIINSNILM